MVPESVLKALERLEDLIVVGHVERPREDADARVNGQELGLQLVEARGAPRAQRQVSAPLRELAGHAPSKTRARAGDEDILSHERPASYPRAPGVVVQRRRVGIQALLSS